MSAAGMAQPVRVTYVFSDGNLPGTLKAFKQLLDERPDLRGRVALSFLTESVFDDADPEELGATTVLVLDTMNQEMLERFNSEHDVDLIQQVNEQGTVLAVGVGLLPKQHYLDLGTVWDERARAFWANQGFANQLGLVKLALDRAGISGLDIPDPQPSLEFGYYYPDGRAGRVFATWDAFDTWRRGAGKTRPGAARIAVGFFKATYYTGDTVLLDRVIQEIESQGAEAVPIFGYPGAVAFERLLLDADGHRRADSALAFLFRFANFEASKPLARLDIPVISLISLYGRSEAEWRRSPSGLSRFEGTFQVAVPELAGLIAPTVIGSQEKVTDPETGLTIVQRTPIDSRVDLVVRRARRYAALRQKPNSEKRLALVFYNYPPGKANIGASYLNVAESLANILTALRDAGYDVGDADLTAKSILEEITTKARNVGGYAPGELRALDEEGSAVHISLPTYEAWLDGYAPALRAKILADWGPPADATLMTVEGPEGPSLVVPLVRYGKVVLLPQPARGWGEDDAKLYHAEDLAPHHQYVATYSWLREDFAADAIIHIGTHGTLEWLDGRDIGLSEEDAPDALLGDLPNINIYNVDVVGEGLVARRRGMATLVDHMVPPLRKGGLYPELAKLSERINDYQSSEHRNPVLAQAFAAEIRELVLSLGIAKDLGLEFEEHSVLDHETVHEIQEHMMDLRDQNIPYGLHAFGRTPEKELRDSTIEAIVSIDRSRLSANTEVLAADMEERITASGPREMESLLRALGGGFVSAGSGGEPVRNPDAYPTGKNFYGIDPDKVPKPAAWRLGVELADQMLANHLEKNGRYPEKVSFVIWGDETMRHEGVLESQIFHLLGTRPVWDARGKVVDVAVVPSAQLSRPRIDIVIASAAEGMFNNVTRLMDKAVQLVKVLEEAENYVRRHYLQTRAALIEKGYSEEDADRRAGVRIFDEPPGKYNLNTAGIVAASGTWDSDTVMTDEYLQKLGHGFGNGFWGEPMEDVFRMALSGTEVVVHSSSTMLYGALDNDDFFMYMGGLAATIRNLDGETPDLVVANMRDPGKPEMTSMDKFIGTEFRSRYVNPTWIEGMQKEGYAGAQQMREFVEYLWGWDATVSELVDDAMWQETFEVYVEDKHSLGMKEFFEENSPFAYQDLTARMVETIRKGYWNADEATKKKLLEQYIESVNRHGVGCSEHTCGNPRLLMYVLEEGTEAGLPMPDLMGLRRAFESAMAVSIPTAATAAADFSRSNEERSREDSRRITENLQFPKPFLEGFRMTEVREAATQVPRVVSGGGRWDGLWVALPVLGVLFLWRARRSA